MQDAQPYLSRLRIQNFRSIADLDIPLGPLTVLVGPNGSGKSNIVDALRFVRDALTRGLDQAVRDRDGFDTIRHWTGAGLTPGLTIEVGFNTESGYLQYGFTLSSSKASEYRVKSEFITIRPRRLKNTFSLKRDPRSQSRQNFLLIPEENYPSFDPSTRVNDAVRWGDETKLFGLDIVYINDGIGITGDNYYTQRDAEILLKGEIFYDLHLSDLRQPQRLVSEWPLDERGQNLAAVLRGILKRKGEDMEDIRAVLARLVDGVKDVSVRTVGGYLVTRLHYATVSGKDRVADLSQESDGTVRMLGMLAALYQNPAPPLIVLEEPEANLHPGALGVLAGVLKQASTRGQVLVTTHSPDLLDHLPPESFVVVEKVDGETKAGPLRQEQREAVRQKLFSPGELMRMEGLERETTP